MTPPTPTGVEAVTLDFYQTLARHRTGRGRGASLMEYLRDEGLASEPWEHRVLYDVFEPHGREYDPSGPPEARARYRRVLARRLFRRLGVRAGDAEADRRAEDIWRILGPESLVLFDDVTGALDALGEADVPLAVVSNWQCGLAHFCAELGILGHFEHVVVSAEVGSEKPDGRIFAEACRRLGRPPARVLHVGDNPVDDVEGGRAAGLQVAWLAREGAPADAQARCIRTLGEVVELL